MSDVLNKLDNLLGMRRDNNGLYGTSPVFEEEMFDRMFEFITSLDPDQLSEDQADEVMDIIESVELEYDDINEEEEYDDEEDEEDEEYDDEEMDEAKAIRVRRNRAAMRKRKIAYKRNKAKRKRMAKRYRKSARGRLMAKKSKRMAKRGKTATGKRKRRFV